MTHLLDTNICSMFIKRPGRLAHRFLQHNGGLCVPTIVLAELYAWAERSTASRLHGAIRDDLLEIVEVLDFDRNCAKVFGRLRADSLNRGTNVPAVDLMIGAVAITHDLTLVTNNTKHFQFIPGLRLDDWLA
jgi:tRNA(fMet)-specific endonuclease VapC